MKGRMLGLVLLRILVRGFGIGEKGRRVELRKVRGGLGNGGRLLGLGEEGYFRLNLGLQCRRMRLDCWRLD